VRELMRHEGHPDDWIDANMPAVLDAYLQALERELALPSAHVEPLAGVLDLLDELVRQLACVVGLLTGNLESGARHKLTAAGIRFEQFRIGAFGSDHEHRVALPAIAQQRARDRLGTAFEGEQVVIVGDTPSDIECGRPIGARTIAVATGHYSLDHLAGHEPTYLFADLSDTRAVLAAIHGV
jgi:phosphoglycolate phosphatase-like HAD superfamily hydrolase